MAVNRYFSSIAAPTTLTGGISNVGVSVPVLATTGFPTSYPYTVSIDYGSSSEELVDVTGAAGLTLTVTRGVDGTSAQSHSVGAVVRHVSSGRDFADAQGHMGAVSAVHGVAGTLVGTSDTQTLANKTLTSPSISGAALSGTLTGSPTFSGAPVFGGTPAFNAGVALTGTVTGAPAFSGGPSFSSVRPLFTRSTGQAAALGTRVTGDTVDRLEVDADGTHRWGTGAVPADTTLYRNSVGELKTDGVLTVAGAVSASNLILPAWVPWTPVWSTSTGLHTPSYGNAVVSGGFVKIGRLLVFTFGVTFGSSTSFGVGATTSDNWFFQLPGSLVASATFAGTQAICGMGRGTQSPGGTLPISVRVDTGGTNLILDTAGARQDTAALANPGSLDSLTPWTWGSGNVVQFFGAVETVS